MTAPEIAVRRLEARDLEGVVDLYEASFPSAAGRPRGEVQRKLGQLFVDGPFCDAALPSLVACAADGRVVGFRGYLRRGWRLGEERLRGGSVTHFMVRKELRRSGISMALRLAYRRTETESGGTRDLSYDDRTTADGRAFGTSDPERRTLHLDAYGFDWSLPLRRGAVRVLRSVGGRLPAGAPRRLLRSALRASPRTATGPAREASGVRVLRSAPLSAAALQEAVAAAGSDRALRLDEPLESWTWLLAYLADYASRGRFSGRVFLAEGGSPLGFCAGYANDSGGYELLAFAAPREAEESALDDVLREARAAGALFVSGTACVRQLRLLLERGAEASPGSRVNLRTLRADVRERFHAMDVLLTGLEGERWL